MKTLCQRILAHFWLSSDSARRGSFINWGVKSSRLFSEGKNVHIIALSSVLDDFDELRQKSQQFYNKS